MSKQPQDRLRLGTRGSLLARSQSQMVADALQMCHPGLRVELEVIKTSGDRITDQPLHAFGGKGLFTRELDQALLAGDIDFAVHSFKDVPVTMPLVDVSDLITAAVPQREDARDLLVTESAQRLRDLPQGARVGTGSLRRRCQLLALRSDLVVESIRGNIDTRLRKLRAGDYDAIVLAAAGVKRAALFEQGWMRPIESDEMLSAPGQGALCIQCRRSDDRTQRLLAALDDLDTAAAIAVERAVVWGLNGDCHSPIAALATIKGNEMSVCVAVGARDGSPPVIRAEALGSRAHSLTAINDVLDRLRVLGVEKLLGTAMRPQTP